jgi:hypothetical protein
MEERSYSLTKESNRYTSLGPSARMIQTGHRFFFLETHAYTSEAGIRQLTRQCSERPHSDGQAASLSVGLLTT